MQFKINNNGIYLPESVQQKLVEEMGPAQERIIHESGEPGGDAFRAGDRMCKRFWDNEAKNPNFRKDLAAGAYSMLHPKTREVMTIRYIVTNGSPKCWCCGQTENSTVMISDKYFGYLCENKCKKIYWIPKGDSMKSLEQAIDEQYKTK
jgi:hypothetical protein